MMTTGKKTDRGGYLSAIFLVSGLILLAEGCQTTGLKNSPAISGESSQKNTGIRQPPGEISRGLAQNTVHGEYLVTVEGNAGANDVLRIFSDFSILSVTALDNTPGVFLLKLRDDPGLEKLQNAAQKAGAVKALQPNFIYRSNNIRQGRPQ